MDTDDAKNKQRVHSSESAAVSSKTPTDTTPSPVRIIQNFHLVWLDKSIDEMHNDDCRNTINKLRQAVNTVNTFINIDECIDFITNINEEKVFIISSGALGPITATVVHDMTHVRALYILCGNKIRHEQWVKQWPKVKGVFTDITPICEALKQATQECDQNSISMSFITPSSGDATQNLDQLDPSFMYTQLLKEILLSINFEQKHFVEFITYCREQLVGNIIELKNVDKLEKGYRDHVPIWWYTYHCFLYSMLNRALRAMEVNLIIKMGFFVRDLHQHVTHLYCDQYTGETKSASFTLYRGQGLSGTDFDQLKKTQGGLLSFNNFLSTSTQRSVSLRFARQTAATSADLMGILFIMNIDPTISSTPFANIRDVSYFRGEEEILFSMHSIFRIGHVKQIDNNPRLWEVDLTLTSDNDPQLRTLTERMREEVEGSTGWYRLGKLLIKMGQFYQAEELYELLLQQITDERDEGNIYYQLGVIKFCQGEYMNAVTLYEKSLKIRQNILTSEHPDVAECYHDIGGVYSSMGKYSKALSYYKKALEICEKSLPVNHPDLATSYSNIGVLYSNMGEYSKALSYYAKAVEIDQKSLPANHPDLAKSYTNIGFAYGKMDEYSKALSYYEKALEIQQKTLPTGHPSLATSYNKIGSVYNDMGEYSKAISYFEKALENKQKSVPEYHSDLAASYNNIGLMHEKTGEYSKALSYYEKSLEIRQKTLPANHHDLGISYACHGSVYDKMGEYSKALSYYTKTLKIDEQTLPENHLDFAPTFGYIGMLSSKLGEHSKAVSFCERALNVLEHSLPANHPRIKLYRDNLENVKRNSN